MPPSYSRVHRRLEAAVEDAISDKEKAQALVAAERAEVSFSGFVVCLYRCSVVVFN